MSMTLQEQRDIIQAALDGERVDIRRMTINNPMGEWSPMKPGEAFDFVNRDYRRAPPALRPHWQALLEVDHVGMVIGDTLFTDIEAARTFYAGHSARVIRLATEYPPVMLP